jgi:cell division protein FtsB
MNVDLGIWSKLTRLIIFLLIIAGVLCVVVLYLPLIQHNEGVRKEILNLDSHIKQQDEYGRQLESTIRALKSDPKAVERVAREKLGYIKPGETMIRFEELPAAARTGTNSVQ